MLQWLRGNSPFLKLFKNKRVQELMKNVLLVSLIDLKGVLIVNFMDLKVILICLKLLTQIQEWELLPVIKQLVKLLFHAHRVVSC